MCERVPGCEDSVTVTSATRPRGERVGQPEPDLSVPPIPLGQEIVALIAHELRGPLAVMSNVLMICRVDGGPAAVSINGRMLTRQVRKALRLVDDLLDVARFGHEVPVVERAPIRLSQVLGDAVQDLVHEIDSRRQVLSLELPTDAVWVRGDALRLEQIVTNLLDNASKYAAVRAEIGLSLRCESGYAAIRVRDEGIGIRSEDLPHIFEPYFRGRRSADRTESGLGLGLALTRWLVELHGGTIEARSDGANRGSEFTVRLPAMSAPPIESESKPAPTAVEAEHAQAAADVRSQIPGCPGTER